MKTSSSNDSVQLALLSPESDLEAVLAAWHEATDRLQKTHESLRGEVKRLTDELEIKNHQLARKNRLADLGQMASHVAHEVRNSLVPMTLYLSLLRRRLAQDAGAMATLDKIEVGFTALEATVNDLLHFTANRDPQRTRFCLQTLLEEVCQSLAPQLEAQGIRTAFDVPEGLQISADRNMLQRAILNLVLNALDVMPEGGELTLQGAVADRMVELRVVDTGVGIGPDVLPRINEPLFTSGLT